MIKRRPDSATQPNRIGTIVFFFFFFFKKIFSTILIPYEITLLLRLVLPATSSPRD